MSLVFFAGFPSFLSFIKILVNVFLKFYKNSG